MRSLAVVIAFCSTTVAHAQGLPSEPVSVGNGRLVVGAELAATIAPKDPGFFNYTSYEYHALRNIRLNVSAELRANDRLQVLGELRVDRGEGFEPYGLYARIRPWPSRRFDIQVGRLPPTFGAFGRGAYGRANLMIGYPLAYQYLTSVRPDALPRNVDELLRMRARGWRTSYSMGSTTAAAGLPLVNSVSWDTGVQVHGIRGPIEWTAAVTTGSLSNPRVDDDNDGRQLAGRVVYHATPGLAVGLSAARAPYLDRSLASSLPAGVEPEDAIQRAIGLDAEYSVGRFIGRGEVIWGRWGLPVTLAGTSATSLGASSVLGEARYRILPGIHLAARLEHLGFERLDVGPQRVQWEAPVQRYELGAGWSIARNIMLKGSWQRNSRTTGRIRHEAFTAAQIVYWF